MKNLPAWVGRVYTISRTQGGMLMLEAGQEIDSRAAEKVMGWRRVTYEEHLRSTGRFPDPMDQEFKDINEYEYCLDTIKFHSDVWVDESGKFMSDLNDDWPLHYDSDWHPSYRIEQAWKVRDKMIEKGYLFTASNNSVVFTLPYWALDFSREVSDNAAYEICKAALIAIGDWV